MHVCLVAEQYPQRLGYLFISENKEAITADVDDYYKETSSKIKSSYGDKFQALVAKFNNPNSFDKLWVEHPKVDIAREKIMNNLKMARELDEDGPVRPPGDF